MGLKGRVAYVTERYREIFGYGDRYFTGNIFGNGWDPDDVDSTWFDASGRIIRHVKIAGIDNQLTTNHHYKNFNSLGLFLDPYLVEDHVEAVFDSNGMIFEKHVIDPLTDEIKTTIRFVHVYDSIGNWTKRYWYADSVPVGITERSIVYFP